MPDPIANDRLPDPLFDLATERLLTSAPSARAGVLADLVAQHPEHERLLRRLAGEVCGAERLLDEGFGAVVPSDPATIGRHVVQGVAGEGAFGVVYHCIQLEPVRRDVAVKVLRPGAGDGSTLLRFHAERQFLANLHHPAIAQVFDAGQLADGRPYFVMEYVPGKPITSYSDLHCLSVEARLELFVRLCQGVQHAHEHGVVHRDLKPANILVVEQDGHGQPKIIDFGIAKMLQPSGDEGQHTATGRVIGTAGYMSPEQTEGKSAEVDERSDLFTLGVILYELLTGTLPFRKPCTDHDSPPRPSARVATSTPRTSEIARQRACPPRRLVSQLRGDLDWIVLRALASERQRRYQAVGELLADVQRHLQHAPVSARPPTLGYRLRRLVRRRRSVLAVAAGLVLAGFGVWMSAHYRSQSHASTDVAEATIARLLARATDPAIVEAPQSTPIRQALVQDALAAYDQLLLHRPTDSRLREGRCRALLAISQVHWLLGEPTCAGLAGAEAARDAESLLAQQPDNLSYKGLLGESLRRQGRASVLAANSVEAQPRFQAAVLQLGPCAAANPAAYGRSHAGAVREAAMTLPPAQVDQRLAGLRECLRVLDALRSVEPRIDGLHNDYVEALCALAHQLGVARRLDEAYAVLTQAETELPHVTSQRQALAYTVRKEQGNVAWETRGQPGRRQAALEHRRRAVEAAAAWHQEQPQSVRPQACLSHALSDLGFVQNYLGDFDASKTSFRAAIERADAMVQQFPDDPGRIVDLCNILTQFSQTLWDGFRQGDLDEASAHAARATVMNDRLTSSAQVGRKPRWRLLARQAEIEDARVGGAADTLWPEVEGAMPADPQVVTMNDKDALLGACCGLARWHCGHGRTADAAAWAERARRRIDDSNRAVLGKRVVEIGWLEARLAAARGDAVAAAAAADRILAARSTWLGTRRAADCLHLAWRCEGAAASGDRYRQAAAELYQRTIRSLAADVGKAPDDPWFVLPWGFANLRAAELAAAAGDVASAREMLAAALPRLEVVRSAAHADQWEEAAFRDGMQLQAKLDAAAARR